MLHSYCKETIGDWNQILEMRRLTGIINNKIIFIQGGLIRRDHIDNLFEKAGISHDDIIHLHGFMPEVRCQNQECNLVFDIGYKSQYETSNGKCPKCFSKLRPNIVFFGEMAPMYDELNNQIQDCEQFVNRLILNNLEASDAIEDGLFSKVIYDKCSVAIDEIEKEIEQFLESL